jgi:F-type H+-transporting ATPase subunit epsilon
MSKSFAIRLITPAGKLLDGQATQAIIPAHDGEIGFLADRAPILFKLGMGQMRVDFAPPTPGDPKSVGNGTRTYLIEDGFGQMVSNRLTVLTSKAWAADEIVEAEAEKELKAAATQRDRDRANAKIRLAKASSGKGI